MLLTNILCGFIIPSGSIGEGEKVQSQQRGFSISFFIEEELGCQSLTHDRMIERPGLLSRCSNPQPLLLALLGLFFKERQQHMPFCLLGVEVHVTLMVSERTDSARAVSFGMWGYGSDGRTGSSTELLCLLLTRRLESLWGSEKLSTNKSVFQGEPCLGGQAWGGQLEVPLEVVSSWHVLKAL